MPEETRAELVIDANFGPADDAREEFNRSLAGLEVPAIGAKPLRGQAAADKIESDFAEQVTAIRPDVGGAVVPTSAVLPGEPPLPPAGGPLDFPAGGGEEAESFAGLLEQIRDVLQDSVAENAERISVGVDQLVELGTEIRNTLDSMLDELQSNSEQAISVHRELIETVEREQVGAREDEAGGRPGGGIAVLPGFGKLIAGIAALFGVTLGLKALFGLLGKSLSDMNEQFKTEAEKLAEISPDIARAFAEREVALLLRDLKILEEGLGGEFAALIDQGTEQLKGTIALTGRINELQTVMSKERLRQAAVEGFGEISNMFVQAKRVIIQGFTDVAKDPTGFRPITPSLAAAVLQTAFQHLFGDKSTTKPDAETPTAPAPSQGPTQPVAPQKPGQQVSSALQMDAAAIEEAMYRAFTRANRQRKPSESVVPKQYDDMFAAEVREAFA